ncbi:ribose-5-phosphate isomerase [Candidatus Curtissbacteria bacterium RIFCSPHIGHO2_12_FULL_38_9b]|uniref:Ribose-5-phosphate isomerase n=1 Tax=Candidatus Curtissbacteria bacterium RIFCSPHIGHO2_12_FULL_38_9b TaxID=1797720 RepID=A0A1F5GTB7_9BACT|nr:MAG: ribose-5-phosphate isomerase [Candidatus Curtissbacteria bacterium RIFCSPHIGHO2_12_FULL_38_9b]
MMIYIAGDHAGFHLKKQLIQYLKVKGLEVKDMGAFELDEEDDYPDFVYPLALRVAKDNSQGKLSFGIVIGGSGNGEAIVANKVRGIRAAVVNSSNVQIARLAREDNDANVLALGARFLSIDEAKMAVSVWLESKFSGGRHEKRITKIRDLEKL